MSIKRIIAFVLLGLMIYGGVYITLFGISENARFSGVERTFYNRSEDLSNGLNIKGSVETVTSVLGSEDITRTMLGMPIGGRSKRYFFALPLGCAENKEDQKYCVIAAVDPKDVEALKALMKNEPAPSDPNAPRFEFRGFVTDNRLDVQTSLSNYLHGIYDTDFHIYTHKNVNKNIAPYTIYVKSDTDDDYPLAITIGLIATVVGSGLFVLLVIGTYRKAHKYD